MKALNDAVLKEFADTVGADNVSADPVILETDTGEAILRPELSVDTKGAVSVCIYLGLPPEQEATANRELIAHSRTDIPALCSAVRALWAENERLRAGEVALELDKLPKWKPTITSTPRCGNDEPDELKA